MIDSNIKSLAIPVYFLFQSKNDKKQKGIILKIFLKINLLFFSFIVVALHSTSYPKQECVFLS